MSDSYRDYQISFYQLRSLKGLILIILYHNQLHLSSFIINLIVEIQSLSLPPYFNGGLVANCPYILISVTILRLITPNPYICYHYRLVYKALGFHIYFKIQKKVTNFPSSSIKSVTGKKLLPAVISPIVWSKLFPYVLKAAPACVKPLPISPELTAKSCET